MQATPKTLAGAILLALLALAIAGCGGGGGSSKATSAAPGASVEFLSPKDGTTTGPTIHAKVKVSGFQGGLRFTMRGEPSRYTASSVPEVTYSKLPSGQHTLHVELVGNGNAATGVGASTTFVVKIVP